MATKGQAYDHPTHTVRRTEHFPLPATAAATSVFKMAAITDMKIKSIAAIVKTAGTADAAGYDVLNGTSSVGSLGIGTNAAASFGTGLTTDISVSSGGYLDFKTKAASATMAVDIAIEYEIPAGAVITS